eukprot:gb/GECG01014958.1/.p1 GENE.gb/GECG01014958.1/~~gb/GECG01014958.1/.p1  ORF type:complete len:237 (+),score=32.92 gb/GECG01014958.1/:1-711(+)
MDLESKTDQWILGLTSAALSAAFGASAAYFHSVVKSGNWYYPRKPRSVTKDTLKKLLEESLEYVKEEAAKTVQDGTDLSNARSVDSKSLKKLHHQLEDKIKRKTEELAGKYHVQEKDLTTALRYYENDPAIKSLKEQHLQEKPMVLFPSNSLRQIYARMIRQIGNELELSAGSLKKQVWGGFIIFAALNQYPCYHFGASCMHRVMRKIHQRSKVLCIQIWNTVKSGRSARFCGTTN